MTALDLGPHDREAEFVWGANLALRRSAFERIGPFDETLGGAGDEEDWQRRLRAAGGRVGYVAAAGVDHRRTGPRRDAARALARRLLPRPRRAPLRRLQGRARRRSPPSCARSAGCVWHVVRRRCGVGVTLTALTLGRLAEALDPAPGAAQRRPTPTTSPAAPARSAAADRAARRGARTCGRALRGLRGRLALRRAARAAPAAARARASASRGPSTCARSRGCGASSRRSRHDVALHLVAARPGRRQVGERQRRARAPRRSAAPTGC